MDARVEEVIAECSKFVADRDDAMELPRESAEFVYVLIRATNAKRGLEIGTSFGFSGLWSGSALRENGGTLDTIDILPEKTDKARGYFKRAGLDDAITCHTAPAMEIIDQLTGPFDFVLNDADKENCRTYLEALMPKLASGAVVLTDNTLTHAEQLTDFVAWARDHRDLKSVHLPMGNGFEMSVRR